MLQFDAEVARPRLGGLDENPGGLEQPRVGAPQAVLGESEAVAGGTSSSPRQLQGIGVALSGLARFKPRIGRVELVASLQHKRQERLGDLEVVMGDDHGGAVDGEELVYQKAASCSPNCSAI